MAWLGDVALVIIEEKSACGVGYGLSAAAQKL
jgi:hypothetical protein